MAMHKRHDTMLMMSCPNKEDLLTAHIPQLLVKPGVQLPIPNRAICIQPAKSQTTTYASTRSRIERISCRIAKSRHSRPCSRHRVVGRSGGSSRLRGLLWNIQSHPTPFKLSNLALEILYTAAPSLFVYTIRIHQCLTFRIEGPVRVVCSGVGVSELLLKPILHRSKVLIYRRKRIGSVVEMIVHAISC